MTVKILKHLLTPITLFVWYLISYSAMALVPFGLIFIFSLSWFWIFLFELLWIGTISFVVIGLPGLLRALILYLYDFSWFSVIAHSLAGLLGIIVFVNNCIVDPELYALYLVGAQEEPVFLLTWMWETAPIKTIFVCFPFIGIALGVPWSILVAPIYAKLAINIKES